jgi:hypothetical protein
MNHRTKFVAGKAPDFPNRSPPFRPASGADTLLDKENWASGIQLDQDGNQYHQREEENEQQRSQQHVNEPLASEIETPVSIPDQDSCCVGPLQRRWLAQFATLTLSIEFSDRMPSRFPHLCDL